HEVQPFPPHFTRLHPISPPCISTYKTSPSQGREGSRGTTPITARKRAVSRYRVTAVFRRRGLPALRNWPSTVLIREDLSAAGLPLFSEGAVYFGSVIALDRAIFKHVRPLIFPIIQRFPAVLNIQKRFQLGRHGPVVTVFSEYPTDFRLHQRLGDPLDGAGRQKQGQDKGRQGRKEIQNGSRIVVLRRQHPEGMDEKAVQKIHVQGAAAQFREKGF